MTPTRLSSLVLLLLVLSLNVMGQDKILVKEHFEGVKLKEVLHIIHEKYGVDIMFRDELVAPFEITAKIKNIPVSETLQQLLSETDLFYTKDEDYKNLYFINRRPEARFLEIYGSITDKNSGAPIVGAAVMSLRSTKTKAIGVNSDERGRFRLSLSKDFHQGDTLEVYFFNYQKQYIPFNRLLQRPDKPLRISLSPSKFELAPVEINADEKGQIPKKEGMQPADRRIELNGSAGEFQLDPAKVGFLVGLGGADILRTIQTLPGISSVDENAGSFNIRGSGEEENRIIYDGITIYSGNRLMGLIGSINQEAVQNVTLYNSGYDVKFGGRTGGIIEMDGRPLKSISEKKSVKTGANVLNLSGFIKAPIEGKEASIMLAGRSSYPNVIQTFPYQRIIESRLNQGVVFADRIDSVGKTSFSDPSYSFFDINGKVNWLVKEARSIFSFTFLKARDDFFYHSQEIDSGYSQTYKHSIGQNASGTSLNWKYYGNENEKYTSNTRLVFSGLHNTYRYQGEDSGGDVFVKRSVVQDKTLSDWSLQHHSVIKPDKYHQIHAGFKIQRLALSYLDRRLIEDTISIQDLSKIESKLIPAFYLQDEWRPKERISVKFGARYTYFPTQQKQLLAPRASLKYQVTENWRFVASGGRYFQYLRHINYLNDIGFGEQFWQLSGVDSLPILRADHLQSGIAFEKSGWTLGLEAYVKNISGLTAPERQLYDLNNLRYYSDGLLLSGTGSTRGIDFYAKFEKELGTNNSSYTGWVSYSVAKTQYRFDEINNGESFLADQDRRHLIKVVSILNLSDKFKLSAVFTWMSGNPVTGITDVTTIPDNNGNPLFLVPVISSQKNGEKLPDYHRLDLTSSWKVFERDGLLGKMGFSIFNVYNRANVRDWIPSNPANNSNNYLEARNLLGISPNLFINLEF